MAFARNATLAMGMATESQESIEFDSAAVRPALVSGIPSSSIWVELTTEQGGHRLQRAGVASFGLSTASFKLDSAGRPTQEGSANVRAWGILDESAYMVRDQNAKCTTTFCGHKLFNFRFIEYWMTVGITIFLN